MTKTMLIDATHPEETRVAVVNGSKLEEFDFESTSKKQLKGNVYLAKVTRVEPSLQAAFIDYGGNRHGFLSFSEIHPDYYQIPVSDREKLIEAESAEENTEEPEEGSAVETVGGDEVEEEVERRRPQSFRRYKVQEVVKRRQILLVQVVKEERGNKGAALTTYLSLAGRYCVLMPNTARGGGISRKIASPKDRKRLKSIVDGLDIPSGMAVIVRTAGADRSKPEIKRDYEYLMRQWDSIRTLTLESTAPCRINEEGNLIKRSIRDLYSKEIEQVLVEGDAGYRLAKDFMKALIPSHAVRVKQYKNETVPILHRYQVESQIDAIHNPIVQLRSGGYLVISPTEALVAIDVNSGRSTRERNIEETAFKTNMETAEELARQLRLRDLAGLIVIDFIDMENSRNIHAVERKLKESMKGDRARIQVGRISPFGLMEMSRQRLRPSVIEASSDVCPVCGGAGHVRSTESAALHAIRMLEEEGVRQPSGVITLHVPTKVALYILNQKRTALTEVEARYSFTVNIEADDTLVPPNFRLERERQPGDSAPVEQSRQAPANRENASNEEGARKRRPRRRRPRQSDDQEAQSTDIVETENSDTESENATESADGENKPAAGDTEDAPKKRSRRGRRGGRRRGRSSQDASNTTDAVVASEATDAPTEGDTGVAETNASPEAASEATPETSDAVVATESSDAAASATAESNDAEEGAQPEAAPKVRRPRRRSRARKAPVNAEADSSAASETASETAEATDAVIEAPAEAPTEISEEPAAPKRPRRRRRTKAATVTEAATVEATDPTPAAEPKPASSDANANVAESPEAAPLAATAATVAPVVETVSEAVPAEATVSEVEATVSEVVAPDAAPKAAPEVVEAPVEPEGPPKSKRGGWWQRVLG
jgi:ribonuclease E